MFNIGYAQEIITPPVGVSLAGYFNKRPNEGMYDDLYVKVLVIDCNGKTFGFIAFDLCSIHKLMFEELKKRIATSRYRESDPSQSEVVDLSDTYAGTR